MATADPRRFIDALAALEQGGEVDAIAALYADDADLSNPLVQHRHRGRDGAARFWKNYRAAFHAIRSEFHHVAVAGDAALLEWTSRGTRSDDKPFEYRGVTVLEYGPDGIRAFRTYFDPRAIGGPAGG